MIFPDHVNVLEDHKLYNSFKSNLSHCVSRVNSTFSHYYDTRTKKLMVKWVADEQS